MISLLLSLFIGIVIFLSYTFIHQSTYTDKEINMIQRIQQLPKFKESLHDFSAKEQTTIKEKSIGGPYGAKTNLILQTHVQYIGQEEYIVLLSKDWQVSVQGRKSVSYWLFHVKNKKITLVSKQDNDDAPQLIR